MQTRCPHCRTVFRVHAEQLSVAGGKVRCGACKAVFDARAQRVKETPARSKAAPPPRAAARPVDAPAPLDPSPVVGAAGRSSLATLTWTLLNLALIFLLVGQYAFHHRETFAAQPALRPVMEGLCAIADCSLPNWRDLAAIELTSRNVQSHPQFDKALLVDATFVNRAPLPQPYPELVVTFLDTEERPIASRSFTPAEYLRGAPPSLLASGAEAHAVLEILDPGDRAFGYEFAFR